MENHLITEINNSREFAKKLQLLLDQQEPRSFDINSIKSLVNSLTTSVEKIMSSAQSAIFEGEQIKPEESPRSVNNSPRLQSRSKKRSRRSMEKVMRRVKVTVNTAKGLAASLEDGYNWRKYGQKGILGTKHPKGYFRCTHSQSRQCLATKHVQMSDEDRAVFDVTYFGEHSCCPGESNKETVRDADVISENTESTSSLSFLDTAMLSLPDMSDWFDQYNTFGLENELPFDPCHYLN